MTPWLQRRAFGALVRLELLRLRGVARRGRGRSGDLPFPSDLAELRERGPWCLAALVEAGAAPAGARLAAFEVTPFAAGLAFRSQLARVRVAWTAPAPGGGEARGDLALVAKLAPEARDLRDHAIYLLQKNHLKEAGFYRDLGAEAALAPRAFFAAADAPSGRFCVLMEALDGLRAVGEAEGCPPDLAALAAREMARFHARHWGLPGGPPAFLEPLPELAIDWFADLARGPHRATLAAVVRRAWRHDLSAPQTVLHGDARVGNMLFPAEDGRGRFALYDWQATRLGRGAFDLAYFLTLSLDPAVRRARWDALLDAYHEALREEGERLGGPQAEALRAYPRAALDDDAFNAVLLTLAFVTLPFLSKESSGTDANAADLRELTDTWRARALAAARDLDVARAARWCGVDPGALGAAFAEGAPG